MTLLFLILKCFADYKPKSINGTMFISSPSFEIYKKKIRINANSDFVMFNFCEDADKSIPTKGNNMKYIYFGLHLFKYRGLEGIFTCNLLIMIMRFSILWKKIVLTLDYDIKNNKSSMQAGYIFQITHMANICINLVF